MITNDPTGELYAMMDEAGLNAGTFLRGNRSMESIVNEVRGKLALKLKDYIERREKI